MGLVTTTPPPRRPLTVQECKDFAKIPHSEDDAELEQLLDASIRHVQNWLGRRLITQTIDWTLDFLPASPVVPLWLPLAPAKSITEIKYQDDAGNWTVWPAAEYQTDLDREPGRVMPAPDHAWPQATRRRLAPVSIRFVCGYGDNAQDVPEDILIGIKQQFTTHYENPSGIVTGTIVTDIPFVLQNLLQPYQVADFA